MWERTVMGISEQTAETETATTPYSSGVHESVLWKGHKSVQWEDTRGRPPPSNQRGVRMHACIAPSHQDPSAIRTQ